MTEQSLVSMVVRAQHGDHRAFDCLVRRYQGTAVAYARTLLHDPAAAEDAAQEAFVRAWQDLPRLTAPAAFGGWLRRIVFKYCDRIRRSTRSVLPLSDALAAPSEEEPSMLVERADQSIRVHAALNALPPAQREATLLYYLTGDSVNEIAAFLELPPSTIKNRLYAARKRLRKELWEMAQNTLGSEKPSHSEEFAAAVLARVLREFQQQESVDRHTADRSLLDQARKALFEAFPSMWLWNPYGILRHSVFIYPPQWSQQQADAGCETCPYTRSPQVYFCPTSGTNQSYGYAYPQMFSVMITVNSVQFPVGAAIPQFSNPASTVMICDTARWLGTAPMSPADNAGFATPDNFVLGYPYAYRPYTNATSAPYAAHNDMANFTFVDGHAKALRVEATVSPTDMWIQTQ